jgi:hypothetical protein
MRWSSPVPSPDATLATGAAQRAQPYRRGHIAPSKPAGTLIPKIIFGEGEKKWLFEKSQNPYIYWAK